MQGIAQSNFSEQTTSQSKVKLSFSNFGTFGNAFRGYRSGSGSPSCAYPDSIAIEHIWEGGIWVGGKSAGMTKVSTAAIDHTQGYNAGTAGYEFTDLNGGMISELSNDLASPHYDSRAIAKQQFEYHITDSNTIIPGTAVQISNHNPLSIDLNMTIYSFSDIENQSIIYVEAEAVNDKIQSSVNRIDSVYFGIYMNAIVRNILATPPGSGGAAFYNKSANGFISNQHAAFTYDYSGDVGRTNTYVAQKILGLEEGSNFYHPDINPNTSIHYNSWFFNNSSGSIFNYPTNDAAKFDKLSDGIQNDPCWTTNSGNCGAGTFQQQLNTAGNRSDLISIGPIRNFDHGDTVTFTFALVFAQKLNDSNPYTANTAAQMKELTDRLDFAQTFFNGEDVNFNGVLDAGEDKDGDGKITRYTQLTTGLKALKQTFDIRFQNPTNGNLWIDFDEKEVMSSIEIFDLSGKMLFADYTKKNQTFQLNINHLNSGTYLLKAKTIDDKVSVKKLVRY